jgi:hypothetical protein
VDWDSGGGRLRYVCARLAEDDAVQSSSSTLVDMKLGYKLTRF